MSKIKQYILLLAAIVLGFSACKNDDSDKSVTKFPDGAFIVNEGPFNNGSGTISYLNKTNNQMTANLFKDVNGTDLGNIVQSMVKRKNEAWIVVNNSGFIKVADLNEFRLQKTLAGFGFPRYMLPIDDRKSYITEWTDSSKASAVRVYDHLTQTSVKSIWLDAPGAEEIVVVGDRAYVSCNGGFGKADKLAIIDTKKDSLIKLVTVGPNPDGLQVDKDNHVWILCSGQWNANYTALAAPGALLRYNTINGTIDRTIPFSSLYSQPANLKMDASKSNLYFNYDGGVRMMPITATSVGAPIINGYFYGLGVDPANGDIYCCDAGDYASSGKLKRYTSAGKIKDSFAVGIAPSDVVFIKQ